MTINTVQRSNIPYLSNLVPKLGIFIIIMRSYTISVLSHTSSQLYIDETNLCISDGTILLDTLMASDKASTKSPAFGSENLIMDGGRTSGTPPTRVDTTNSPHDAASNKAMQNDSVREQFRKICPLTNT